ncbi:hydroxymethylcytosylglucuronate/cytosylglucuronate synthase [Streptomyces natalensis]|uniref:hydroxymethylcytosylglucuronate/cytosylglucurona te synthase n=1 Tax=Streptomyces natalensis TaxID=68242 RepID=UPI000B27000B|nr:hydroxymethylcytosylglucuronate/cytosylglucuronate synthase [Streptomyces natalensis]
MAGKDRPVPPTWHDVPAPAGAARSTVVFRGHDFGWGSAGKLHAVLTELTARTAHPPRLIGVGTVLGRSLLAQLPVDTWYDQWPSTTGELRNLLRRHGVTAALVVLDSEFAAALLAAGCPTVFVDSLPYLWTGNDTIPHDATRYCAQLCESLPRTCWEPLRRIERLTWTEAILSAPPPTRRAGTPGLAVLNFGGLHSPFGEGSAHAYPRLVAEPAVRALSDAGFHTVEICGNVDTAMLPEQDTTPGVAVNAGPRSHEEFLDLLDRAQLLVTSPGLTTLLEAGQRRLPTVCLPPQNVSQILNGNRFAAAVDAACRVPWPSEVLDPRQVDAVRAQGEHAALTVVYGAIERAARQTHSWVRQRLHRDITTAIEHSRGVRDWGGLLGRTGGRGAHQVVQRLTEVLAEHSAPAPVSQGAG